MGLCGMHINPPPETVKRPKALPGLPVEAG